MSNVSVTHQEAAECIHAVHEGDAAEGDRRMYTEGVGCDQSDSWPQGYFLAGFSN